MRTLIETTAVLDLTPRDLDNLVEELRAYHAIYSPLFQRRAQRAWAEKYLRGLLLELPRKSIEPLVLTVEGAQPQPVRAMPQFLSELDGARFTTWPRRGESARGTRRRTGGGNLPGMVHLARL